MKNRVLIISLLMSISPLFGEDSFFERSTWDFGTIEEMGGNVEHRFEYVNGGSDPVVINHVAVSCGCTKPTYSRRPLLPGESSHIDITFDPRYRPGKFMKEIYVYMSGGDEPIILKISGVVTPRVLTMEERFPFLLGGGLRISTLYPIIRGIVEGESTMTAIEYMNVTDGDLDVELVPRSDGRGLYLHYEPRLSAGESVTMSIGYEYVEGRSLDDKDQLRDTLDVYVGGAFTGKQLFVTGRVLR